MRAALPLWIPALVLLACEPDACEEDPRAQVLEARVELTVGDQTVEAELAATQSERERGWRHRECDREALLLVPDAPGPLPVWGCGLTAPVDLAFVRDGQVVMVQPKVQPCPEPCGTCDLFGEGVDVDAVLEVPAGALELAEGMSVEGVPAP